MTNSSGPKIIPYSLNRSKKSACRQCLKDFKIGENILSKIRSGNNRAYYCLKCAKLVKII